MSGNINMLRFCGARHGSTKGNQLVIALFIVIIGSIVIGLNGYSMRRDQKRDVELSNRVYAVQFAAEEFAVHNNGFYPSSLTDTTLVGGDTMLSLLSDDPRIRKYFSSKILEPVDGVVSLPGQVGYQPYYEKGMIVGYIITYRYYSKTGEIFSLTRIPIMMPTCISS